MKHKLGICIPYRDRKEHLDKLIPHLTRHLNNQGIDHGFYVAHQVDDKLFNRGAMKNIAAKYAFEDGCDYIAWHDVDMLPYFGADYSYPKNSPTHIATKLSKYNYGMGYDEYFGGVVLFTKEQAEKTNGYSNEYWDWGQEDDDLLWRCYYEGYTIEKTFKEYNNKKFIEFDGENDKVDLKIDREVNSSLSGDHTISILFKAEQQPNKTPIWLIGDTDRKFVEYPLLRKEDGNNWGFSFNNSRAITSMYVDKNNQNYYNWGKRRENQWTWLTSTYNSKTKQVFFYLNDELISNFRGSKSNGDGLVINEPLKMFKSTKSLILGYCPLSNVNFKGKISEVRIFNKSINNVGEIFNDDDLIFYFDGSDDLKIGYENIKVIGNIIPHRKDGRFECLPHIDEGFINGKWAKGETTASNEKRFVTKMQQGIIEYKNDGFNNINYHLINIEEDNNIKLINVKL